MPCLQKSEPSGASSHRSLNSLRTLAPALQTNLWVLIASPSQDLRFLATLPTSGFFRLALRKHLFAYREPNMLQFDTYDDTTNRVHGDWNVDGKQAACSGAAAGSGLGAR
jgi:hypothetical protein